MARAHKVFKSFSPNPTKATNAMEEYERKNKKEIHKELQDLDPIGSPHMEEILIDGNIELDLLSLFPQIDARIIGGIESYQAWEVYDRGQNLQERLRIHWGRRVP
jgi:hypothetical protein